MSETANQVHGRFAFEKKMGATTLQFTVEVVRLGVTPAEPEVPGPHPVFATAGESLWYFWIEGPGDTITQGYRSYVADVTPEQVAAFIFGDLGRR